jgi:hypothetical protein
MFNILLKGALQNARNASGDASCDPCKISKDFYSRIPEEIRPYFNQPRGVQLNDGTYLGSIVQIAKGSLGRLHGPALELFTASILQLLLEMDERPSEELSNNPTVIQYEGQDVKWDVRRYSSSQDKSGRWQSIPDYSLYFDCTQVEMRESLTKQKEAAQAEPDNTPASEGNVQL